MCEKTNGSDIVSFKIQGKVTTVRLTKEILKDMDHLIETKKKYTCRADIIHKAVFDLIKKEKEEEENPPKDFFKKPPQEEKETE